jgi:16S rRNA processing protein RimM
LNERRVVVGTISGLYGVKGWVKVHSFTSPPDNILAYRPWFLARSGQKSGSDDQLAGGIDVRDGRVHGKGLVVQFGGIDDRDAAAQWVGAEIQVDRECFASAEAGQFYWADLIGLTVLGTDGGELGAVDSLLETGANDVLVVVGDRRHLVPFVFGSVVTEVDLELRRITVDWDSDL